VLCWEQSLPFGAPARLTSRLHCHCRRVVAAVPPAVGHVSGHRCRCGSRRSTRSARCGWCCCCHIYRTVVTRGTWDIATDTPCCLWCSGNHTPFQLPTCPWYVQPNAFRCCCCCCRCIAQWSRTVSRTSCPFQSDALLLLLLLPPLYLAVAARDSNRNRGRPIFLGPGALLSKQGPRRAHLRAAPLPHSHNALVATSCFCAPAGGPSEGPGVPSQHRAPTSVHWRGHLCASWCLLLAGAPALVCELFVLGCWPATGALGSAEMHRSLVDPVISASPPILAFLLCLKFDIDLGARGSRTRGGRVS
jgi:hypothetical protein